MRFPVHRGSVGSARDFVATTLSGQQLDDLVDEGTLLTSELVANAIIHGRRGLVDRGLLLRLITTEDTVRIEVRDDSTGLPVVGEPSTDRRSGWGMLLVERIAADWGVIDDGVGKWVWCELRRPVLPESVGHSPAGLSPA